MSPIIARFSLVLAATAGLTTVSLSAHAEDTTYRSADHWGRSGLTAGADLGFGTMRCSGDGGCDDFTESGSFGLHIGAMLNSRLAILADAWLMLHTEDRLTVSQGFLTAAARVWAIPHLWFQAGLGVARAEYRYDGTFAEFGDHTEWVPAFQLGVGVEVIATHSFGLDIAFRYGTGFYSDGAYRIHNLALVVGASFY